MLNMKCNKCRFWYPNLDYAKADLKSRAYHETGECHHRSPIADHQWPKTNHWDWCGAFEEDGRLFPVTRQSEGEE